MHSSRRRLLIGLGLGFAVLIGGTGLALAGVLGRRVTEEFDAALLAKARAIAALTEQEGEDIEFDYAPEHMPEFEGGERPEYFQFWLDDGTVLLRSARLPPGGNLERSGSPTALPRIQDTVLPDGRRGRQVEIAYVPGSRADLGDSGDGDADAAGSAASPRGLLLVVARGRENLDALIAGLRTSVLAGSGIAALLAALLLWGALAAAFKPVQALAEQVRELDAAQLDARITLPETPSELAPIVGQMNALLSRLEEAFQRERRFTGNVAHELRTPIAELRSLAAVGARWPEDTKAIVAFFEDVRAIASRMEGTITDLLLLARCEAGLETGARAPLRLKEAVAGAWSKVRERAQAGGMDVRLDVPGEIVVDTDAGMFQSVLGNLLENAVCHALPGTSIHCRAERNQTCFRLEIRNAARLLAPEDLPRLTEPFWRGDPSRSSTEHSGLGLALVSALAKILALEVSFAQETGGEFCARLEGSALALRGMAGPPPALVRLRKPSGSPAESSS